MGTKTENKSTKTTQTMNQPGGFNMPSAPSAPGGPGFDPSSTSLPTSTVEISVRCTDLADKDVMSKSDPICVMFIQKQGKWFEIGRTEMIADTLNPSGRKNSSLITVLKKDRWSNLKSMIGMSIQNYCLTMIFLAVLKLRWVQLYLQTNTLQCFVMSTNLDQKSTFSQKNSNLAKK